MGVRWGFIGFHRISMKSHRNPSYSVTGIAKRPSARRRKWTASANMNKTLSIDLESGRRRRGRRQAPGGSRYSTVRKALVRYESQGLSTPAPLQKSHWFPAAERYSFLLYISSIPPIHIFCLCKYYYSNRLCHYHSDSNMHCVAYYVFIYLSKCSVHSFHFICSVLFTHARTHVDLLLRILFGRRHILVLHPGPADYYLSHLSFSVQMFIYSFILFILLIGIFCFPCILYYPDILLLHLLQAAPPSAAPPSGRSW